MPARKNRPGKCGTPTYAGPIVTTPEERLLLAIFGKPDGLSVDEAIRQMRMSSSPGISPGGDTPTT